MLLWGFADRLAERQNGWVAAGRFLIFDVLFATACTGMALRAPQWVRRRWAMQRPVWNLTETVISVLSCASWFALDLYISHNLPHRVSLPWWLIAQPLFVAACLVTIGAASYRESRATHASER